MKAHCDCYTTNNHSMVLDGIEGFAAKLSLLYLFTKWSKYMDGKIILHIRIAIENLPCFVEMETSSICCLPDLRSCVIEYISSRGGQPAERLLIKYLPIVDGR